MFQSFPIRRTHCSQSTPRQKTILPLVLIFLLVQSYDTRNSFSTAFLVKAAKTTSLKNDSYTRKHKRSTQVGSLDRRTIHHPIPQSHNRVRIASSLPKDRDIHEFNLSYLHQQDKEKIERLPHISLTELHQKNLENRKRRGSGTKTAQQQEHQESTESKVISTTVEIRITPIEDNMDKYQSEVFERGLLDFLKGQFATQDMYSVDILDVTVVHCEIRPMGTKRDRKGRGRLLTITSDDNHVLHVETVIVAQLNIDTSSKRSNSSNTKTTNSITSDEFCNIVVNYSSQFKSSLIDSWKEKEMSTIDKNDDRYEDHLYFGNVIDLDMDQLEYDQSNGDMNVHGAGKNEPIDEDGGSSHWKSGIIIGVIALICAVATCLAIYIVRKRREGNQNSTANEELNSISLGDDSSITCSNTENLYDLIKKVEDEITFEPSEKRRGRLRKKRYLQLQKNKSGSFEDDSSFSSLPSQTSMTTTTLRGRAVVKKNHIAPPGKLGCSIDTVDGQPVVHRIKPGSPLEGVLQRLDIIIAVDEVDTSNMSASEVTFLMAKRMSKDRKITFLRGTDEEE